MATNSFRKKSGLLDWKNEKKYQEKVLKSPGSSAADKAAASARIKQANEWIKKLSK